MIGRDSRGLLNSQYMRDETLEESSRTTLQIHTDAFVADLHSDVPMRMAQGVDIGRRDTKGHMEWQALLGARAKYQQGQPFRAVCQ